MTPDQITELRALVVAGRERVGRLMLATAEVERETIEVRYSAWRVRAELRAVQGGTP